MVHASSISDGLGGSVVGGNVGATVVVGAAVVSAAVVVGAAVVGAVVGAGVVVSPPPPEMQPQIRTNTIKIGIIFNIILCKSKHLKKHVFFGTV